MMTDQAPLLWYSLVRSRWTLIALGVVLMLANILYRYPGELKFDALIQYWQVTSGVYNDYHPPVMTRFWSLLHPIADGTAPIYVAHLLMYWFAFILLGYELHRRARPISGLFVIAVGATPLFIMMNIVVISDVGLASAFLAVIGLWLRVQRRGGWSVDTVILVSLLLFYGTLIRANAVFAVPPLLLLIFGRRLTIRGLPTTLALSAVIAVLLIPTSSFVNRVVLGASPGGAIGTLQFFDVMGIVRLSGDRSVLRDFAGQYPADRHCYSPVMHDTLGVRCKQFTEMVRSSPELPSIWIGSIKRHPVSYLEHRLLNLNSAFFFYVPPFHVALAHADRDNAKPPYLSNKGWILDTLRSIPILSAASIIVLAVGLYLMIGGAEYRNQIELVAARAMLTSAILYSAAFAVVNVASEQRYSLWLLMATMTSTVIAAPVLRKRLVARDPTLIVVACLIVGVNAVEEYARWTVDTSLTAF
ncbi:hypothetical protein [Sphingomonas sp. PAMC 26621]|uniref:hypothetical protein n=1 Tax=Sphingomonas sp. PAMC 26621 TaxID=1112213 RepID=UPI000289C002|nr:hypothetical protein [Sphingomonas sp. PAMC 26621]